MGTDSESGKIAGEETLIVLLLHGQDRFGINGGLEQNGFLETMAKPIYAGTYPSRKGGRWKRVFVVILLLHLIALGIFLYLKKDKTDSASPQAPNKEHAGSETVNSVSGATETYSTPESQAEVRRARTAIDNGDLVTARANLSEIIETTADSKAVELLGKTNIELLNKCSTELVGMTRYNIQSGDSLDKIARHYGTTVKLIQKMNHIENPNRIRVNQTIFVFSGNFSIRVSKTKNELDLLSNGKLFKRYSVGTGKMGKTPAVEFTIVDKIENPPWTRLTDNKRIEFGDPENVLGTRWMKLESKEHPDLTGFGIHGTWEDNSIGKQSSMGCIRMHNTDVEELFDLVPNKTVVTVTE